MPWWGLTLVIVIVGAFSVIFMLNWQSDVRRNPERKSIKREPVTFRYPSMPACVIGLDGKPQAALLKNAELVIHLQSVEISFPLPGLWLLAPEWFRRSGDIRMEAVEGEAFPFFLRRQRICLTMRTGGHFDKVWLMPPPKDLGLVWEALAAAGVVAWSAPPRSYSSTM